MFQADGTAHAKALEVRGGEVGLRKEATLAGMQSQKFLYPD